MMRYLNILITLAFLSGCASTLVREVREDLEDAAQTSDAVSNKVEIEIKELNDEYEKLISHVQTRVKVWQERLEKLECTIPVGKLGRMTAGGESEKETAARIYEKCGGIFNMDVKITVEPKDN